ncbi:alpha/beta hydrolase [Sulfurirhabdus autotrophica]|uniref:Phospholipase/carboxylesterase n=1 Tax=Sulfurirhabdus autotrophica TaxID=1706046 RepID=A0A4R3Y1F0_9PROT|nr:dienelactone hydrolase family protein [Sulfurirhabdus autotrophica]TCV85337.1 phospholipase/carboxylesterase [Sulfurirhabdus autotrophica]
MTTEVLPHLEITTGLSPSASIIWLHGLGADGHDFESIVGELSLPDDLSVRFILPHAPSMAVTINNGYVMPAWYDIFHPDLTTSEDEAGIRQTQKAIEKLIQRETDRGIFSERIILAGFSQGGAIALHTGLRYADRLAGILALSTYIPLQSTFANEASRTNGHLPIFMAHGSADTVIPITKAVASKNLLLENHYNVEWHEYAMAHSLCQEEVSDINDWLISVLG